MSFNLFSFCPFVCLWNAFQSVCSNDKWHGPTTSRHWFIMFHFSIFWSAVVDISGLKQQKKKFLLILNKHTQSIMFVSASIFLSQSCVHSSLILSLSLSVSDVSVSLLSLLVTTCGLALFSVSLFVSWKLCWVPLSGRFLPDVLKGTHFLGGDQQPVLIEVRRLSGVTLKGIGELDNF